MDRKELTRQYVKDIRSIAAEHGVNASIEYVRALQNEQIEAILSQESDERIAAIDNAIKILADEKPPH